MEPIYVVVEVDNPSEDTRDIAGVACDYGYQESLDLAQDDVKSYEHPENFKIFKLTAEEIPYDARADIESGKINDAMNRLKEVK